MILQGSVPCPSRPHKLQVHQEEDQCHQASATYHKSTLTRWWIDVATNAKTNGLGECQTNIPIYHTFEGGEGALHAACFANLKHIPSLVAMRPFHIGFLRIFRTNSRVRGAIIGWWPSFHAPFLRLRFRVKCSKNPPKKGTWIFSKRLVQGFLVLGTEDGFCSCLYLNGHPSRNPRSMHNNIWKRSGQTNSLNLDQGPAREFSSPTYQWFGCRSGKAGWFSASTQLACSATRLGISTQLYPPRKTKTIAMSRSHEVKCLNSRW